MPAPDEGAQEKTAQEKKAYRGPEFRAYGDIRELTLNVGKGGLRDGPGMFAKTA